MTGSWYDALWEEVGSVLHDVCLARWGWLLAGWKVGLLVQVTLLSVVDDALAPSTSTSIVLLRYLSIRNPFFYSSHTYVYQVPTKQQTKAKMIIL